jgi:hypothetical protein
MIISAMLACTYAEILKAKNENQVSTTNSDRLNTKGGRASMGAMLLSVRGCSCKCLLNLFKWCVCVRVRACVCVCVCVCKDIYLDRKT